MKPLPILVALLLPFVSQALDPQSQIKAVLDTQVAAWNRADIPTFVTTYSDDCIFVGKTITQGRAQVQANYQKRYATPEAMGRLTFSNLAIHMLEKNVATLTADWHLDRTPVAGGPVGGYFSLVLHKQSGTWKIALDHTTALP